MNDSSEVKNDFKVSWQLLKANYKAFLATEIFAFASFIVIFALFWGIVVLVFHLSPTLTLEILRDDYIRDRDISFSILGTIIVAVSHAIMNGFLNCQFGLSYDIMSSGDMFSEFRRVFSYFRRYWWQYILLSFFSGFGLFLPEGRALIPRPKTVGSVFLDIGFIIIRFTLLFVLLLFTNNILPSLTAQGSFKNSFKEASRILNKYPKRVFKTWGRYFLIFILPTFILAIIRSELHVFFEHEWWIFIFDALGLFAYLIYLFVGIPIATLIATRIYNSVEIERFQPLTENDDSGKTED